jgi:probable phosphoglycerate mutase
MLSGNSTPPGGLNRHGTALARRLWIVRHGQSAGNVARDAADAAGVGRIDIADRDMDVPLSPLGQEQATALGRWLATQPEDERPRTIMASPYRRAVQTSQLIRDQPAA